MTAGGYRGHIDAVEPALEGWVCDAARPDEPVLILVTIDRLHRLVAIADRPRPDVALAGLGGPNCGFAVPLPQELFDGSEHEIALALADGRLLDLPGRALRIALGPLDAAIVRVASGDREAVADLLRRTESEAGYDPAVLTDAKVAAWIATVARPQGGLMLAAKIGRRLVGYCRIERPPGRAGYLGVVALTVLAAYRRKGLGERLLRALLATVQAEQEIEEVWLSVDPQNLPALRLYEKLGFVRRAIRLASWPVPAGFLTMVWLPSRAAGAC